MAPNSGTPLGTDAFLNCRFCKRAFYVAGGDNAVANFFFLFDDFLVWKAKQIDRNVMVQINQYGEQQITNAFV